MQDDRLASRSAAVTRAIAQPAPPSLAAQAAAVAARISPLQLGVVQALIAFVFTTLMLSVPPRQPGFQGVVNNVNSPRAYRRLDLWIRDLGWVGEHLSGLVVNPDLFIWMMRGGVISMAAIQLVALIAVGVQVRAGTAGPRWRWLAGPLLTMAIFLLYPPLCSDIFYYTTSGAIANSGGNPYEHPLRVYYDAPLLAYNDWAHIASPYGPVWTGFCRLIVGIFGTEPLMVITAFRLLAVASAVVFVILIYQLALRLTGDERLALVAMAGSAWMPVLVFETSTGAHNDALMFDFALGGLLMLTTRRRGSTRLGLALIAVSALLKYVTLPLLVFAALWRLADRKPGEPLRKLITAWALDVAMALAMVVAFFAPYWVGLHTFHSLMAQPARGVSSTIWVLPHEFIRRAWGNGPAEHFDNVVGFATLVGLLPIFALAFLWLFWRMWGFHGADGLCDHGPTRDRRLLVMLKAWLVCAGLLPFFPVDTHNWYGIWAIGPISILLVWLWGRAAYPAAVRAHDRVPGWIERIGPVRLAGLYLAFALVNFLVYHTRVLI